MAKPQAEIHPPTNLYPDSAFLHGACRSTGDLPTKFRFGYTSGFWPITHYGPWWDVDHAGEHFDWNEGLFTWRAKSQCWAEAQNADGFDKSGVITFYCPTPSRPDLGAPWVVTDFYGACHDHYYLFTTQTNIPCHLTALIGIRKPYISPTTHITKGVVFHHDAILIFYGHHKLEQFEPGDTISHVFDYHYYFYDHPYYIIMLGTVDGKKSPSLSPVYEFMCIAPPIMEIDDAYDITQHSAKLPGHLVDDKGVKTYCRFNYGIHPNWTHNTPTLGPEKSPYDYEELIEDLEPDTEYWFRAEGSHQYHFPYHGISYPKHFNTLPPPPLVEKYALPGTARTSDTVYSDIWYGDSWLAPQDFTLSAIDLALSVYREEQCDVATLILTENPVCGGDYGEIIATSEITLPLLPERLDFLWVRFPFPDIPIQSGHLYAHLVKGCTEHYNPPRFRLGRVFTPWDGIHQNWLSYQTHTPPFAITCDYNAAHSYRLLHP